MQKNAPRTDIGWLTGAIIGVILFFLPFYYLFFSAQWRIDEVCASIPSSGLTVEEMKNAATAKQIKFFVSAPPNQQNAMIYADVPTIRLIRHVTIKDNRVRECQKAK